MEYYLITPMVFLPLLGAALQIFVPKAPAVGKGVALASSLLSTLCALFLVSLISSQTAGLQANEILPWIGSYAIGYDMAVDGLNILLVLMIGIAFPVLIAAEWDQKLSQRGIYSLLLVLQASLAGAVCAQDAFLQLTFWGLSALPVYFLIGIWGSEAREQVAFRTIVPAAIGNALLFAALLLIYYAADPHTFSLRDLAGGKIAAKSFPFAGGELPVAETSLGLIAFGLALRAPIWPLHGWFVQIAKNSPPTIVVAQALTSMVAPYIFLRLGLTLFPETMKHLGPVIVAIGAANLLISGVCAAGQRDLRMLLAYACIAEIGLVLIGIGSLSPQSVVGAVFQLLVFGLAIAAFGLIAGVVADRTQETRFLDDQGERVLGGAAMRAPTLAFVSAVFIASLLGFPGSGGFVGHSLVALGSFSVHPIVVAFIGLAALLATYTYFTVYRLVFLGRQKGLEAASAGFPDLGVRERSYLLPLVAALLAFGIYPKPLLDLVNPTVQMLLETIK